MTTGIWTVTAASINLKIEQIYFLTNLLIIKTNFLTQVQKQKTYKYFF